MSSFLPPLIADAVRQISAFDAPLWLDFRPWDILLCIFDGQNSYLVGTTPQQPGWTSCEGGWLWPGQHAALIANTCVEVEPKLLAAGVQLPSLGPVDAAKLASILVHEAFHVWQHLHPSPAWEANELAALSYPVTAEVLHTRAEEAFWLQQRLEAPTEMALAHALYWRAERFKLISDKHRQLERRMETLEGLAQFVEQRFLGHTPQLTPVLALESSPRAWAYHSGALLAFLLARQKSEWQQHVMLGESLDELLSGKHPPQPVEPHTELHEAAQEHAKQIAREQADMLTEFHTQPGLRLILTCPEGMMVEGFDPMNVVRLGPDLWLHRRYLKVAHPDGVIEIRQGQGLAKGPNLFSIKKLELISVLEPLLVETRWQLDSEALRLDVPIQGLKIMQR